MYASTNKKNVYVDLIVCCDFIRTINFYFDIHLYLLSDKILNPLLVQFRDVQVKN